LAKTVTVNRAQVRAARLIVSRAARGIGEASPAVRAIAQAKRSPTDKSTSAVTEADRRSED